MMGKLQLCVTQVSRYGGLIDVEYDFPLYRNIPVKWVVYPKYFINFWEIM